jgi:4-amino-4-deoxy-L-arabinose transferase-like glycosyltransferase
MKSSNSTLTNGAAVRVVSYRQDLLAIALLTLTVAAIYGARLARQPVVGEETRYATAAREMLATGDWTVVRQQGQIFPERPPMSIWPMALLGELRGDVDPMAIRLASVTAVVLTSLLIYGYSRQFLSVAAAFAAGLIYATFGQVLQIGRLGESEAIFALFVAASLLLWHLGYSRGWWPLVVWSIGGGCAALAALTKGPQAPVYFGAITGAYLLLRRDWRYLFSWQTIAGVGVFAAVMACWQVPYYYATNWDAVVATWAGLAGDRFSLKGAAGHIVTYPLETFVCLLPWSPLLFSLFHPMARKLLSDGRGVALFLVTAMVVAYPTVWIASGARGRYFMPLYPVAAVLIALVLDRTSRAAVGTYPRRAWHQFLLTWGLVIGCTAALMAVCAVSPNLAGKFHQPAGASIIFAIAGIVAVALIWFAFRKPATIAPLAAVLGIASFAAFGVSGAMINVNTARWSNPTPAIVELRQMLPAGAKLVSLGPVDHRFIYFYDEDVREDRWPVAVSDLSEDVDFFCFTRDPNDTPKSRASGRGRRWTTTPGTLPFVWEEVATMCAERQVKGNPPIVVFGRVVRPLVAQKTDVTQPRPTTAHLPTGTIRK